jgi:GNAT superfamily N-acetyltransferase
MHLTQWDDKVEDVLTIAKSFIAEASYPISYSEDAINYVWTLFTDPSTAIFLNYQNGKIAGGAIVQRSKGFHSEYMGYIQKFYIMPEGRKTRAARELIQEVTDWFDKSQCVVSIGSGAAGIQQNQLFINLLKKAGYESLDGAMIRKRKI